MVKPSKLWETNSIFNALQEMRMLNRVKVNGDILNGLNHKSVIPTVTKILTFKQGKTKSIQETMGKPRSHHDSGNANPVHNTRKAFQVTSNINCFITIATLKP